MIKKHLENIKDAVLMILFVLVTSILVSLLCALLIIQSQVNIVKVNQSIDYEAQSNSYEFVVVRKENIAGERVDIGYFKNTGIMYAISSNGTIEKLTDAEGNVLTYSSNN